MPHRRIRLANLCGVIALACGVLFADCGRTFDGTSDPTVALLSTQPPNSLLSFERDVIPALTKAGCNAGACHGSFQGRGGFRLSLLGFDPAFDHDALAKEARGRRVNRAAPQQSLLLQKASGAVPHGGGRRITTDSEVYRILHDYIAQGLPQPPAAEPRIISLSTNPAAIILKPGGEAALQVFARWSDGTERDVTPWALYDSRDASLADVSRTGVVSVLRPGKSAITVRYLGQAAAVDVTIPYADAGEFADFTPQNFIDELVAAEWRRVGLAPAEPSSDAEFLRRVYVDLIGTLPSPVAVRAFLNDPADDKRERVIDSLLDRPEYADYWSVKWGDLLRVHRRYVGDKGLASFSGWLKQSLRENRPVDQLVRELLTSQGNVFQSGPVAFYFVDEKPEDLAETTAQVFLGIRMQCARCHHHPFEAWGQDDYYGLAAFFTRLEIKQPQELGSQGRFGGARILRAIQHDTPQRALKVPSAAHVLGGENIAVERDGDIRVDLADWVTSPENAYFARNIVNRYWAYLTGRGLVEPVDDLRVTNPPTNPALLEALAREFVAHGCDLKQLLRTMTASHTYQLASRINPERDAEGVFYAFHVPRRLSAEVLLDGINQACGSTEAFAGLPAGTRAIALPDPTVTSTFLDTFGRPARNNPCECARRGEPDLSQVLQLLNGEALHQKIAGESGRVAQLLNSERPDAEIIEELYLATLSRPPSAEEQELARSLIAEGPDRREAVEDLLWTLLNCTEFLFNH